VKNALERHWPCLTVERAGVLTLAQMKERGVFLPHSCLPIDQKGRGDPGAVAGGTAGTTFDENNFNVHHTAGSSGKHAITTNGFGSGSGDEDSSFPIPWLVVSFSESDLSWADFNDKVHSFILIILFLYCYS